MRQYHMITMIIVALVLVAFYYWQVGDLPFGAAGGAAKEDQVVGVERFDGDPQESIRALCLSSGQKVTAGNRELRRMIENGDRRFYVRTERGEVEVIIVDGETGPYFRTKGDDTTENNLLNLPDCI